MTTPTRSTVAHNSYNYRAYNTYTLPVVQDYALQHFPEAFAQFPPIANDAFQKQTEISSIQACEKKLWVGRFKGTLFKEKVWAHVLFPGTVTFWWDSGDKVAKRGFDDVIWEWPFSILQKRHRIEKQRMIPSVVYWCFVQAGHLPRFVEGKNVTRDAFKLGCERIARKIVFTMEKELGLNGEEDVKGGEDITANEDMNEIEAMMRASPDRKRKRTEEKEADGEKYLELLNSNVTD